MRTFTLAILTALLSSWAAAHDGEVAKDYPTVERVMFVEACAREHPDRQHTEMIYKCSCAMDVIVSQLSYPDYVEASTAFFGAQVAGERGAQVREGVARDGLADRYRQARGEALRRCMIQ